MLVKVFAPKRTAHRKLLCMDFHPKSAGILQPLYACTRKIVTVFCSKTNPPPKGMLSTMALLSRIMATETTVDAMHSAANVTLELLGVSSFSGILTSTSSVFVSPFIWNYAVCVRFYVVRAVSRASFHAY